MEIMTLVSGARGKISIVFADELFTIIIEYRPILTTTNPLRFMHEINTDYFYGDDVLTNEQFDAELAKHVTVVQRIAIDQIHETIKKLVITTDKKEED